MKAGQSKVINSGHFASFSQSLLKVRTHVYLIQLGTRESRWTSLLYAERKLKSVWEGREMEFRETFMMWLKEKVEQDRVGENSAGNYNNSWKKVIGRRREKGKWLQVSHSLDWKKSIALTKWHLKEIGRSVSLEGSEWVWFQTWGVWSDTEDLNENIQLAHLLFVWNLYSASF